MIKKLLLSDSDVYDGKTDTQKIVDKINEIVDYINEDNYVDTLYTSLPPMTKEQLELLENKDERQVSLEII